MSKEIVQRYIAMRRNHPAWLLLASQKGPLILASLKQLIESNPTGVDFDEAVEKLASVFAEHVNDSEFDLGGDQALEARKELRQWLKRGLIVERGGKILATDAFQRSLIFVASLEDQAMTSTASRLATVQRAIEILESQLSQNQIDREKSLQARINALVKELKSVQAGEFEVLDGPRAEEGIREVYQLAVSLQVDFRRVEDSYREADRLLRQRIISENQNRGQIVDELLNGHEQLVQTVEGQVFESFYAQLVKSSELQEMKSRLRAILENKNTDRALARKQKAELGQLVSRLVQESERVIQARARSEKDVRGFLQSGLADEQLRVGMLLQEIFQIALELDWSSQKLRRVDSPLPPIAVAINNLPLVERLLPKQIAEETAEQLALDTHQADPNLMGEEFWNAYHAMNRTEVFLETLARLREQNAPLTIAQLAVDLPPTHDLETLAFWLAMARQAGIPLGDATETFELTDAKGEQTRFTVPQVKVDYTAVKDLKVESLE